MWHGTEQWFAEEETLCDMKQSSGLRRKRHYVAWNRALVMLTWIV